ncbi:hypothetical protein [Sphingobacterium sp. 2149]|uniref:hypothetical protein n=1 Tax=Sphingobacterium sp. 2149 TaxID=2817763 RepID=UPI001AE98887|nr:hypothetical protein [Sphingobacterium sp. 2149]MDR6733304.1 hypothetical protein [Sphingobacterium sp. 2149]
MKSIIILLLLPLLIACHTNSFDLDKLSFPADIASLAKKYELRTNSDLSGIIVYNSTDQALLQFSGYSFSGTLNKQDASILSTNSVSFYDNRTTKKVNAYRQEIKTTKKAEEFENMLVKKFGKTEFYYRDTEFSYRMIA